MSLPVMNTPKYVPKIGDTITVELPDERTRATIESIVSDEVVIARIQHFTTAHKSHNYRKGELIGCRFQGLAMNARGWKVVSQEELDDAEDAKALEREEAESEQEGPREMVEGDL